MSTYSPSQLGIKPPSGGFQTGGWYNSRQYWNGTLSDPGVIHPESNQQGAGKEVSAPVIAASNPAQGLTPGTNEAYIAQQRANQAKQNPTPAVAGPSGTPNFVDESGASIPGGGGIGALMSTKPTIDLTSVYNSAYNTPEVTAANKAISDAQAEIDKAQQAHDEEIALINDNPLYSAARMVGKQEKVDKKFSADLSRLQTAKALAADSLAKLKADAEIKVNLAMKQYDINNQAYKDQLDLFNTLLKEGALINASGSDIASYAVATGIPTSMIASIVAKQKNDEIKPQVITATDNAGNMTAVVIDQNTGNVINRTSLGRIGGADKTTQSENKEVYVSQAKTDARSGVTLQQMLQIYSPNYLSPDEVYGIYNSNSVAGQGGYGPAKETPEQLRQLGISVPSSTSTPADELIKMKQAGLIK